MSSVLWLLMLFVMLVFLFFFFFSSRRRHTRSTRDWSSDVCSSDLILEGTKRDRLTGRNVGRVVPCPPGLREVLRAMRSEERRVGKECRTRRAPYQLKKK